MQEITANKPTKMFNYPNLFANKFVMMSFIFVIVLFIGLAVLLLWAWFGKLEESVPGIGELRPVGHIQKVMSPQDGIVARLLVKENDYIKAGDPILILDPEMSEIEQIGIAKQMHLIKGQSDALLSAYTNQNLASKGTLENEWLKTIRHNYLTKLSAAEMDIKRTEYDYKSAVASLEESKKLLESSQSLFKNYKDLYELGGIAENEVKRVEQDVLAKKATIAALEEQVKSRYYQIEQAKKIPMQIKTDLDKDVLSKLVDYQKSVAQLQTDFSKSKTILKRQVITAPIDGYVNEMKVVGTGEVIRAGEPLVSIVPDNTNLVAELKVTNNDLSYIKIGQEVALRIDAFPYQRFGRYYGVIESISPSTIYTQTGQQTIPFYKIIVKPKDGQKLVDKDGYAHTLRSGMTVSADIVTREENFITFIIEPIFKTFDRAFRDPSSR